jgi:hypothetical protein
MAGGWQLRGGGGASSPITATTSIGWVGGSSAIESTTQPGARWRISAASARRARLDDQRGGNRADAAFGHDRAHPLADGARQIGLDHRLAGDRIVHAPTIIPSSWAEGEHRQALGRPADTRHDQPAQLGTQGSTSLSCSVVWSTPCARPKGSAADGRW